MRTTHIDLDAGSSVDEVPIRDLGFGESKPL
jgi:hypothetical protein